MTQRNKPIPFKIQKSKNHALLVQVDEMPFFYNLLHYHPEFQITAIERGQGFFYAGNGMSDFKEMDIFFIGPNVPHLLKCPEPYYRDNSPGVKGISLFFDELSFGKHFFDIKEMYSLKTFLSTSKRVIKVSGALEQALFDNIASTPYLQNEQLIITFLEILSQGLKAHKTYINNHPYNLTLSTDEGSRLNLVLEHTFKRLTEPITIEQISGIASLSRSQFSSFFKKHTGKTYIQFLNELRIENACILLKNHKYTIEQVCYEVGFQNVSNFIRQFKSVKTVTPSKYRQSMKL